MDKFLRALAFLAAVSVVLAIGLVVYDYLQVKERFPAQTFIGNANVSGLDQAAAYEKLNQLELSAVYSPLITFEADGLAFSFSPEALGLYIDNQATTNNAFKLTHQDGYLSELKERIERGVIRCPLILGVQESSLVDVVEALAAEVNSTARDASVILYEESGGYHIEPEVPGRMVQVAKTLALFKERLAQGSVVFPLVIEYETPRVTEKMLRAAPPVRRLSAYTTYYGAHDSPNRIHNIKLVASWINGTLLMPGDTFSVADTLGEITPERGFKEAYVIVQGVLTPLLGGGSCQIATTLYNAVQLSDLKILQRKSHSMYFNIYPLGRDAGVYPGQLDFKFENDTAFPILIKAVATNRRLSFRVYGTPNGKSVKFSYPVVYMLTENGYVPSTVKAVLAADAPFKTVVVRTVSDASGKELKTETITSFYKLYGEKTNVPIARPEPR
ncbi:MAG: VanW family protein [Candidatus Margulisbacteria bacterium]|nr:VanW family protein [Candidatus Margulisiibacteriota bacterium]